MKAHSFQNATPLPQLHRRKKKQILTPMNSQNLISVYYVYCNDLSIYLISLLASSCRAGSCIFYSPHTPSTFSFQGLEKDHTSPLYSLNLK